jgi:hypothetical protein
MGSINIQTNKERSIFQFPKIIVQKMGCPALGIWVGFLKQPALPGKASQKKILQKKF